MRFIKHTFVLNLLIILTLGGAGFFSYKSFESYRTISGSEEKINLLPFLDNISTLSDAIDKEVLESVSYLVKKNKISLEGMLRARENTDRYLHRFFMQIEREDMFRLLQKDMYLVSQALQHARKETDALPSKVIEMFFANYYLNISIPLTKMVTTLAIVPAFKKEAKSLLLYQKILALKTGTSFENSMVYMLLVQHHPVTAKEKYILEQIVVKDRLPELKYFLDEAESTELQTLLSSETYKSYLSDMRKKIIEESAKGSYTVDVVAWLDQVQKKKAALDTLEEKLRSGFLPAEYSYINKIMPSLLYIGAALFLLFSMVKLILLRTAQIKNRKLYDDTLREIELVFDQEQQKKLKRLVEQGNLDLIYKFLLQAIKDANHTKDLFLANMSHEIRTPLNGIVGFTQLLQETETTEEQKEFLTIVAKSSEHLLKIVNDILDLAKIKAQKIELESITFDPLDDFETAVESYAGKAYKENIDLNVFIDPHLPTAVKGDPTKVSQILVNLLSNAIKFTSKNGEVNVTIEKRSENNHEIEIYFAISDTGVGISKKQREKIFQAFSQADVSTSRKYGGTGLGLSISGRLIELMGGKLGIRSIPNEGSTFHFSLKFEKVQNTREREVETMHHMHIGILDPHIDLQYYHNKNLAAYLSFIGAKVTHYTDRTIIAAKERGELPDILFIDHKFRQRDGELEPFLDLCCRIILLTTGDQKRSLERYMDQIDTLLYKPVTFSKTYKVLNHTGDEEEHSNDVCFEHLHILVAEDNTINQKLIKNVLNRIGIEVTIVNNGQEALNFRKEKRGDMIFMDIEMPVMGGMEATAKILGYERTEHKKHVPIIALTANALSGDRAKYLGAGMDGYLSKPIQLEELRKLFLSYFPDRIRAHKVA